MRYAIPKIIVSCCIIGAAFACQTDDDGGTTQLEEQQQLDAMLAEIRGLVNQPCEDASTWKLTPIGSKPCGGPWSYLPYPSTIDTTAFLKKVQDYADAQDNFNRKWSIVSDCLLVSPPDGVRCENGQARTFFNREAEERAQLDAQLEAIKTLANQSCVDEGLWSYIGVGAKPCGGVRQYIAFPSTIDLTDFFEKVQEYTKEENFFNERWNVISDCAVVPEPKGVTCIENKAVLVF